MAGEVGRLGEALGLRGLDHRLDRPGQDRRVVGRDQALAMPGAVDLADPADIGRDQRLRGRGRFQDDIGQGFRPRRDHHGPGAGQGLADRGGRLEYALVGDAALARHLPQFDLVRPGPDDQDARRQLVPAAQ